MGGIIQLFGGGGVWGREGVGFESLTSIRNVRICQSV